MANDYKKSALAVTAEANAFRSLLNSGLLTIYAGDAPVNADTACTTQAPLVSLTFNTTAFAAATTTSPGVLSANALTAGNSTATGTAVFFRCLGSATTCYVQGTIGTTASTSFDLLLNSIALTSGASVSISSFTHTIPTS
jgi:hypothetical protein